MKRALKIYLEKPELAGIVFLVLLTIVFQVQTGGVFLNAQNVQGMLGILAGDGDGRHRRNLAYDLRRVRSIGGFGLSHSRR